MNVTKKQFCQPADICAASGCWSGGKRPIFIIDLMYGKAFEV
jgi:hypothetical protein